MYVDSASGRGPRLSGAEIDSVTLGFSDRSLEQDFAAHRRRQSLKSIRIWGLWGLGAYVALGAAEF